MDIVGLRPKNNKGKYFHNTIWYWAPLWEYVGQVCSDILTVSDIEGGVGNDGYRITAAKAMRIGMRLQELIQNGNAGVRSRTGGGRQKAKKSAALANAEMLTKTLGAKERPQFSVENVRAFADFCLASGGFEID